MSSTQNQTSTGSSNEYVWFRIQRRGSSNTTYIYERIPAYLFRGKSEYIDRLLEIQEQTSNSIIPLYDVNIITIAHRLQFCSDIFITDYFTFMSAMDFAWRYDFKQLFKLVVEFAESAPIPQSFIDNSHLLQKLMRHLRGRVSTKTQVACLDQILNYELVNFVRPGAFIKEAFAFNEKGFFSHKFVSNNQKIKKTATKCCQPSDSELEDSISSLFCLTCQMFICSKCKSNRCNASMSNFIETSTKIRVYGTVRPNARSRKNRSRRCSSKCSSFIVHE